MGRKSRMKRERRAEGYTPEEPNSPNWWRSQLIYWTVVAVVVITALIAVARPRPETVSIRQSFLLMMGFHMFIQPYVFKISVYSVMVIVRAFKSAAPLYRTTNRNRTYGHSYLTKEVFFVGYAIWIYLTLEMLTMLASGHFLLLEPLLGPLDIFDHAGSAVESFGLAGFVGVILWSLWRHRSWLRGAGDAQDEPSADAQQISG